MSGPDKRRLRLLCISGFTRAPARYKYRDYIIRKYWPRSRRWKTRLKISCTSSLFEGMLILATGIVLFIIVAAEKHLRLRITVYVRPGYDHFCWPGTALHQPDSGKMGLTHLLQELIGGLAQSLQIFTVAGRPLLLPYFKTARPNNRNIGYPF